MAEQDSGRKTLSVKPGAAASDTVDKPSAKPGASGSGKTGGLKSRNVVAEPKRTRSGTRARAVAQMERARDQEARKTESEREKQLRETRHRNERVHGERLTAERARPADALAGRSASRPASAPASSPVLNETSSQSAPALGEDHHDRVAPGSDQPIDHDVPAKGTRAARSPKPIRDSETFQIFAPCPVGLEEALAAEMTALGFDAVTAGRAGCHFVTDWWGVQRANLYSRLATRILVRLAHAPVQREDDILELARSVEWERWFGPEHTLRVDTSAIRSPMQSLQYCNLRAKDGICDRLREREGARPSIDTVRPDARVHLFLSADTATLYLDTSGESLFKRGWRLDKGEAPLRENLAAGLLALSGWDPEGALLDPFCGSGTILIEAAWIALGVPPGITRPFGFERLRGHQSGRWLDVKEDAQSRIRPELVAPLVGIDSDPGALEAARRNAERAHLTEDSIRFELGDARDAVAPAPTGWILTTPPYGDRLEDQDLAFWREWSSNLKKEFAGWQVNVITSDLDFPQHLRLKPKRRIPIFNGALDCRLFSFELVAEGYRD